MTRVPFVRGLFALASIGLSVLATSSSVHAERVLSDLEASKLTFASLTAPPPVIRARHAVRHASTTTGRASHKVLLASAHGKMVHLVSYHPTAHTVVHSSKHHHRT
ncbi:hypothetical protein GOB86_00265 [Acetobacter lambici]|uniref:Uncharacterized protein n=1 Tax=Acetobacter lambici TaxID=1332824 RepID=A0ABT1EVP2_9PROT|nr:hypothetical protein [Acetobacter lambici]MCP1241303.1 hypothetical protein [Acetobacter lambici]MCP1257027.1 hypothetical protein [Acetobacter lambici]NHO55520.1 hypothetical protein [Acetobacter lambici]